MVPVADDRRAGRLIAPFAARIGSPGGYDLVAPTVKADLHRVATFHAWLLAAIS